MRPATLVASFPHQTEADCLVFSTDSGLSKTARWAAKQKLANLLGGMRKVGKELGV